MNQNSQDNATPRFVDKQDCTFTETDDERHARLKRPVGVIDAVLIKQSCPEIPENFILKMMFGGG